MLSEDVKEILRQQHAFYWDQIKALQKTSPRKPNNPIRAVHLTHLMNLPEDMYSVVEQGETEAEGATTNPLQKTLSFPHSNIFCRKLESMFPILPGL